MFILCLFENPQENTLPSLTPQLPNALRSLALRVGRLTWESPFNLFLFLNIEFLPVRNMELSFWRKVVKDLMKIKLTILQSSPVFHRPGWWEDPWKASDFQKSDSNPPGMRKKSTWDAHSRWEHFQQQWRPLSWWIGVDNIGLLYSEHSVCYHVTQTHCVFDLCVAVLPVYNETIVLPIASPNVQTLHMSRPCPRLLHIFFHLEVKAELTWKFQISPGRQ